MKRITLLTGGSRSGKSSLALQIAGEYEEKAFIATAEPFDDEMRARISRHRSERGAGFVTIEEPVDVAGALRSLPAGMGVAIIDCLTVWLGNLMHRFGDGCHSYSQVDELVALLKDPPCDLVVVTSEVGMGIVPDNRLSRKFRDMAGSINQRIASAAGRVIFMVSGIPLTVKDGEKR